MNIPLFPTDFLQVVPFNSKSDAESHAALELQNGSNVFLYRTEGGVDLYDAMGGLQPVSSSASLKWVVIAWRTAPNA